MAASAIAPGARVLIRDAEWIVKRVDRTGTGGQSIQAIGVSEIVRHREARFLSEIEGKSITVLDPAETELVPDSSPQFRSSRLYLESLLRQSPPTGNDLWIGHRAAIDDLPYQLEPALLALEQPRQRILIADSVGLGKTIEVGILLSELIKRGKGKRILVVTTKSMMAQFQEELWTRFTIPVVRLDSVGLERVRNRIPTNANPFHHYDKAIISIDTLKQNAEFRAWTERSYWDVIVIDEAHNVAERGDKQSMRSRLAGMLSRMSDTLIMASATPHDGRAASFASLMNMLDPTAIADPNNYGQKDIEGLYLRRYKKDIQEQIAGFFLERFVSKHPVTASPAEEAVYDCLAAARFLSFDRSRRAGQLLFKTVLEKSLFSSPAACVATIHQRMRRLEGESGEDAEHDRRTLTQIAEICGRIGPSDYTKYQRLLEILRPGRSMNWSPADPCDRIVLFTERIETLRFLEANLIRDLQLRPDQVAVVHGSGIEDVDLQKVIKEFGRDHAPVRLLLASDIASEGLNLHFLCHKLIHFDIPWSLMVFQQRNGRVDRYGQARQPHIAYLFTEPQNTHVRGDVRILELLVKKDGQAAKNIGDPSIFQGVFDAREEEQMTGRAMEEKLSPAEFDRQMEQAAHDDLLAILLGDTPAPTGQASAGRCHTIPSLFADDFAYFREGLAALAPGVGVQVDFDSEHRLVTLTVNDDLRRTFRALPPEAIPDDGRLHLTTSRDRVKKAIDEARAEERQDAWPRVHLLWDLHPVMEWLDFKLMVAFGRKQAPTVRLEGALRPDESLFLMEGEIPNRKAQPVIHEWFCVRFEAQRYSGIISLQDLLRRTQFGSRAYANRGASEVPVAIQALLPSAVAEARSYMSSRRQAFENDLQVRLQEIRRNLADLEDRQLGFLELKFPEDSTLTGARRNKKDEWKHHIDGIFRDHRRFVEETLTTEDSPFLRVAAVLMG
ncbi:MAG: DEAD/DEAH box helicase [Terriglobia bacterium]